MQDEITTTEDCNCRCHKKGSVNHEALISRLQKDLELYGIEHE